VPATDYPASTGVGQVQIGLGQLTLLGQLRGAIDLPLNIAIPCLAADDVSGAIIHTAGKAIPVISADFRRAELSPINAAAIVVASNTLLEQGAAESALTARITRAAVTACDAKFVALALDGAASVASGANTPALLLAQVSAAAAALIAEGADARFITLSANPSTLLELACASTSTGARAFPEVTAQGGSLAGMPFVASRGIAVGRIVAIAGDAVLRSPVTPQVEASQHAHLELADNPTGEAEPGTDAVPQSRTTVSMFQADLTALRIIMTFGADFTRDVRAAFIDGIDLAGELTA
jgi:hypothetical protein